MSLFTIEVVASTVRSCVNAERGGAGRIELCAALATAGITPSAGLLQAVKQEISIPVYVMLRPREGDFHYGRQELDVIKRDIEIFRRNGADGFVFGVLRENGSVDLQTAKQLVELCKPLPSTFHRAIDCAPDMNEALEMIIESGCEKILTSGGKTTGPEGIAKILELCAQAAGRIVVMPGGGIRRETFHAVLHPALKEYHLSGRKEVRSAQPSTLFEMDWAETDETSVRGVVDACGKFFAP